MTPRIPGGRVGRALVLAWLVALALPIAVTAHAELLRANPEDDEVVTAPVTAVTGRYSEDLKDGSRLVIKDASGATVGTGTIDPENDRRMIARFDAALRDGAYTVESTSISAQDGDVERVTWSFSVAVATPTPSPSAEPTAICTDGCDGRSSGGPPTPTAGPSDSPSPTASPVPGDTTSGTGEVLLPIIAALAIVAVGAGFLLDRSRTRRP